MSKPHTFSDWDVKIFSNGEDRKIFGDLESTQSSRDIIDLLIENEMYQNEIATKLNLRRNTVHHHLSRMKEINLVEVTLKEIVKNGEKHEFYKIPPAILILPATHNNKKIQDKILKRIFRPAVRFSAIAITAPFLWLFGNHNQPFDNSNQPDDGRSGFDRFTSTMNTSETDPLAHISETDSSLILPLIFVIFGLIVEVIILQKKKKKIRITQRS